MADQLEKLNSPCQRRSVDGMISWTSSPSPYGWSKDISSPFLQFSPSSFICDGEGEHSNSIVSVFSPSIFSPSKSNFNVTSRLLKKRDYGSSSSYQTGDFSNDFSSHPIQLPDLQESQSNDFQHSDYPPSSSTSPMIDIDVNENHLSMDGLVCEVRPPKISIETEKWQKSSRRGFKRSVLFSPETSSKSCASSTQLPPSIIQSNFSGIPDLGRIDCSDRRGDQCDMNDIETDGKFPFLGRKMGRTVSIDQTSNSSSIINLKHENEFIVTSFASITKLRSGSEDYRSSIKSTGRSAYTSPSVQPSQQQAHVINTLQTPTPLTQCKCKKSKCLKLYCDCFALLKFCGPQCGCDKCHNDEAHEETRKVAIAATMQRTPTAFTSKVTPTSAHVAGCHCSKSNCLKKYCECFLGGAMCGLNCKCQSCKNFLGSEALNTIRVVTENSTKKQPKQPIGNCKSSPPGYEGERLVSTRGVDDSFPQVEDLKEEERDCILTEHTTSVAGTEFLPQHVLLMGLDRLPLDEGGNKKYGLDSQIVRADQCRREDGAESLGARTGIIRDDVKNVEKGEERKFEPLMNKKKGRIISTGNEERRPVTRLSRLNSKELKKSLLSPSFLLSPDSVAFVASVSPSDTLERKKQKQRHEFEFENEKRREKSVAEETKDRFGSSAASSGSSSNMFSPATTSFSLGEPLPSIVAIEMKPAGAQTQPMKRRRLKETLIVYPFFGPFLPKAPKICALRCLEYLDCKDIYSTSVLNKLWSKTSTDSALWE